MDEETTPQHLGEDRLAELHARLLARDDLQFRFPDFAPPEPPAWAAWFVRLLEAIAPFLKVLFWGGLILGALLVLVFAVREVQASYRRRRRAADAEPPESWAPAPEAARALLEDADRLAAEGRFDEAVRLLLFRSIDDLSGRRPEWVRPALTSRDIARITAMPGAAREAFARIAAAVEKSLFGGRPVGAGEFGECRRAYEAFAFAEGWT